MNAKDIDNEPIAENTSIPLELPPEADIETAFDGLILSASGWRKVFAPSGDEEDPSRDLLPRDAVLVAAAAMTFLEFLRTSAPTKVCALGTDTRPTGNTIADICARVLSAGGLEVRYLGALPAPEIMAYVRGSGDVSAFAYVSASHNPVGHNGFKFGLDDGGVLGGTRATGLINAFKKICADRRRLAEALSMAHRADPAVMKAVYAAMPGYKEASSSAYDTLTREVVSGSGDTALQERFFSSLRKHTGTVAAVADFNGSARTRSIDRDILARAGVDLSAINDVPGGIAHRIVPEGESLTPCRQELERLYRRDSRYVFGYMPDNDGDRGNLVYLDTRTGRAEILQAQEVFALAVLAELAYDRAPATDGCKPAVAVNGPTSRRIERIASYFGAEVFRCEVGEANVVELARKKRAEGYTVRILGEGSNGGNITHPSSVRDPVNTVFSLLKLLLLKDDPALFRTWCSLSGKSSPCRDDFGIRDILDSLPVYTTTGAYDEEAKLRISTRNHAALKAAWETIFLRDWEKKKDNLRRTRNIVSWAEVNFQGTEAVTGFGPSCRSGEEKGGLSILFRDSRGQVKAYIWMRGSGTEPVFRVLADVEGDDRPFHDELLSWQRAMVMEADSRCG